MMKTSLSLAMSLAALSCVEAKEHYVIKEDVAQKEHKRPKVEQGETEVCYKDEESFKLCGTYGASAKVGWEWQQEFYKITEAEKYYSLNLDLYSKQGLNLDGVFFADRLYSNETNITLDSFKALVSLRWKHFYSTGRSCIAGLYAIDDLVFEIKMRMKFLEASKIIIQHPWTLDQWDSPYAVWLDAFDLSDSTPILLKKIEITQTNSEKAIFGQLEDSAACIAISLGFDSLNNKSYSPLNHLMSNAVQNGIDYLWENYEHQNGGQLY